MSKLSQDLLHECIIGLIDDTAFDRIKDISHSILGAMETLCEEQNRALDTFITPYKALTRVPRAGLSLSGLI
jgi:hypothetical protein